MMMMMMMCQTSTYNYQYSVVGFLFLSCILQWSRAPQTNPHQAFYLLLSLAVTSTVSPNYSPVSNSLLSVCLHSPYLFLPCGFQRKDSLVTQIAGFLNMCPFQHQCQFLTLWFTGMSSSLNKPHFSNCVFYHFNDSILQGPS